MYTFVKNKLDTLITILMCVVIGIICVSKGGFYKEDILFPTTIICVLGAVFALSRLALNITDTSVKKKNILVTLLDILVVLMPISYALPLIFNKAVSIENSLFEVLRYINFAIVYFVSKVTIKKKYFVITIIACSTLIGIFGIDELTTRTLEPYLSFVNARYLSTFSGRLSSFIQYANVSAALLLIGSFFAQYEALKNINNGSILKTIKQGTFIYLSIFSQICMLLTESRMNFVFFIIISIILSIYFAIIRNKKNVFICVLSLITVIMASSVIDFFITSMSYNMVYLVLFVLLLLCIAGAFILKGLKNHKISALRLSKKIKIMAVVIIGMLSIFLIYSVFTVGQDLIIDTNNSESETVRYLYNVISGKQNNVSISYSYDCYTDNSNCIVFLYEVNENNTIEYIYEKKISKDEDTNEINFNFEAKDSTKVLEIIIQTKDCKLVIEDFKLNGKECILSYKYFPDELMFRLKNTGRIDAENEARYIYYEDAVKLVKMSPFIGQGGEAFLTRYQEVQSEGYISSEVHSYPLQLLVETGIIGLIVYIAIIVIAVIIAVLNIINYIRLQKNWNKQDNEYINIQNKLNFQIYVLILLMSLIIISMFDLTFSFGITICIFAIIIGFIVSNHLEDCPKDGKLSYTVDDKSTIALVKTVALTIVLIILCFTVIYSVKLYKASIIKLPQNSYDDTVSDAEKIACVYPRINAMEKKCNLDKYNLDYMSALCDEYAIYINTLRSMYLNVEAEQREVLDKQIADATVAQKEIADRIIECEYYNKYALYEVAQCYFSNYLYYAEIYQDNFESAEVAYAFYLNYALNLTKRIKSIASQNQVANDMYNNIYEKYIDVLERQQIYLNSVSVQNVLLQMKDAMKRGS